MSKRTNDIVKKVYPGRGGWRCGCGCKMFEGDDYTLIPDGEQKCLICGIRISIARCEELELQIGIMKATMQNGCKKNER